MKTWDDYKRHVKDISDQDRRNMEEIEEAAALWLPLSGGGRS